MVQKRLGTTVVEDRGQWRTVMSFRPRSSMQGLKVLSFFSTKKKPAPAGYYEEKMSPAMRLPLMLVSRYFLWGRQRIQLPLRQ